MKKLFVFLLITLLMGACKPVEYDNAREFFLLKLPDYTETGQQTMGCLINGSVWSNFGKTEEGGGIIPRSFEENRVHVWYDSESIWVQGKLTVVHDSEEQFSQDMHFHFKVSGVGEYFIGNDGESLLQFEDSRNGMKYMSMQDRPMTFKVLKDDGRVISGMFSGFIYRESFPGDSLSITQGRFDVKRY